MDYSLQLKKYEGPMDLLFDLINRNQIDIKDISIVEITDQYVEYVNNLKEIDLDFASDFISMASKLLEIKSRYVLYIKYKDDDEESQDPRLELVQKIEEYKKFRLLSDHLEEKIAYIDPRFYREKELIKFDDDLDELNYDLSKVNIEEIERVLPYILREIRKNTDIDNVAKIEKKLDEIVKNQIIPVEVRINEIRSILDSSKTFSFNKFTQNNNKNVIIADFLAVLELIKLKEINISQESFCKEILITKK